MRERNLKSILPPPIICAALAALLIAACSLIQEMPKEFMDTYGNIAHVEKVEYEGLAEGGGDTPRVTETRDFRIIYTIGNPGDFDLAPEFSFEGGDAEVKKIETEKRRVSLTVSGASLGTLEDGAALKVRLLLYMASQKILQSAYEIDMLYVRTGPPAGADPSNPGGSGGSQGGVDPSSPGDPSGGGDASSPGGAPGAEYPSDPEPEEPVPPGNTVYVRGKDATWYAQNNPDAEASNDNSGDEDAPFATVQRAVDEILARNDGEGRYEILIDGTLEGDRGAGENGMADFSALGKDLTLTIKALSGTATLDAGANVVIDDDGGATVMPEGIGKRVIYAKPASGALNLTLENLAIKGGNPSSDSGGGIYASGISLTIKDCAIIGNSAQYGGGIYAKNATVTMSGCEVSGNAAGAGGGVYASGKFTMSGGSISKNASPSTSGTIGGGGVYLAAGGTFNMTGGEISGNTSASKGGGVRLGGSGAAFTMSGSATIAGNKAVSDNTAYGYGGGVYLSSTGTLTVEGGTISGNQARYGGGVASDGTFNMKGGTIGGSDENTAVNGGGVYFAGTNFTMTGGTIAGNAANGTDNTSGGGGVYLASGTFEMSGGTIGGSGSDKNTAKYGGGVYAASGSTFKMSDSATISGNSADSSGGGAYVAGGAFTMSGSAAISGNAASGKFTIEGGTTVYHGGGGVYVASGTFTMKGGTIGKNTMAQNGGGVHVFGSNSTFTMTGGTISGNFADGSVGNTYGGGVCVRDGGKFEISGSAIISENKSRAGAGIYVVNSTFDMNAGEISGNIANVSNDVQGGGVHIANGGTFNMSGGKITDNTAVYGSGVFVTGTGTFNMNDGAEVTNNYVCLVSPATITVGELSDASTVATIQPYNYDKDVIQVLSKGDGITEITPEICKKFDVKPNGSTKYTIVPDGNKQYGVLAKADVSGDGIEVTMPGGDVYTFEVRDGNYKIIGTDTSELKQGSTISLISVTKNGTALAASDGTFTIEIQDASKTRFENENNPPYNTGFNQPAHVPEVPVETPAFVYVKAELKDGPTVETHISVTIEP